jgi:hypothetical protein
VSQQEPSLTPVVKWSSCHATCGGVSGRACAWDDALQVRSPSWARVSEIRARWRGKWTRPAAPQA